MKSSIITISSSPVFHVLFPFRSRSFISLFISVDSLQNTATTARCHDRCNSREQSALLIEFQHFELEPWLPHNVPEVVTSTIYSHDTFLTSDISPCRSLPLVNESLRVLHASKCLQQTQARSMKPTRFVDDCVLVQNVI